MIVKSYERTETAALHLTETLLDLMGEKGPDPFFLAISGGRNPAVLFRLWAENYKLKLPWKRIFLFWVDERCVPPTDAESNFLMTKTNLLDKVPLKKDQIFRIRGEEDPLAEAKRYSGLVRHLLPEQSGFPVFDCVLLGVGPDGHTSSVFPGQKHLYEVAEPYAVSRQPQSGQLRVALMPRTILHAKQIFFFATGEEKKNILKSVIEGDESLPAGYIARHVPDSVLYTA